MPPLVLLGAVNAAISLIETLAPAIEEEVKKGTISPETQAALQARKDAIRLAGAFKGPEWEQSK